MDSVWILLFLFIFILVVVAVIGFMFPEWVGITSNKPADGTAVQDEKKD